MRFSRQLRNESQHWVTQGLIDSATRQGILDLYPEKSYSATQILFSIAVVFMGFSLFLLLSANWQSLGQMVQFCTVLGALCVNLGLVYWFEQKGKQQTAETLAFLSCFVFGIGIWLTAQIFHLSSHFPNGVLLWALGIAPMVYIYPKMAFVLFLSWLVNGTLILELKHPMHYCLFYLPFQALLLYLVRSWPTYPYQLLLSWYIGLILWVANFSQALIYPHFPGFGWYFQTLFCSAFSLFSVSLLLSSAKGSMDQGQNLLKKCMPLVFFLLLLLSFYDVMYANLNNENRPILPYLILWCVHFSIQFVCIILPQLPNLNDYFVQERITSIRLSCLSLGVNLLIALSTLLVHFNWFSESDMSVILIICINLLLFITGIRLIRAGVQQGEVYWFQSGIGILLALGFCRYLSLIGDYITSSILFFVAALALYYSAVFWEKVQEGRS